MKDFAHTLVSRSDMTSSENKNSVKVGFSAKIAHGHWPSKMFFIYLMVSLLFCFDW